MIQSRCSNRFWIVTVCLWASAMVASCGTAGGGAGTSDSEPADTLDRRGADGETGDDDLNDAQPAPPPDVVCSFSDTIPDLPDSFDVEGPQLPEAGSFGMTCIENADCQSGWCLKAWEGGEGLCSRTCMEDCPEGFSCKGVSTRADMEFLCVPACASGESLGCIGKRIAKCSEGDIEPVVTFQVEAECDDLCLDGQCYECGSESIGICLNDTYVVVDGCGRFSGEMKVCGPCQQCTPNGCVDCVPNDHFACVGSDVFWVDSCERPEGLAKQCAKCSGGECVKCTSHDHQGCVGDSIHWFDACDRAEESVKGCGPELTCRDGECAEPCTLSDCDVGSFTYSCASGDSVSNVSYCPSSGNVSHVSVEYANGHTVDCSLDCDGTGGTCSDDTGATCSF